jgi:hypothetical protein
MTVWVPPLITRRPPNSPPTGRRGRHRRGSRNGRAAPGHSRLPASSSGGQRPARPVPQRRRRHGTCHRHVYFDEPGMGHHDLRDQGGVPGEHLLSVGWAGCHAVKPVNSHCYPSGSPLLVSQHAMNSLWSGRHPKVPVPGESSIGARGQLTDELVGQVAQEVRPVRQGGHGQAWDQMEACQEQIAGLVRQGLSVVKIGVLWKGRASLFRTGRCPGSVSSGAGSGRTAATVRVADGNRGWNASWTSATWACWLAGGGSAAQGARADFHCGVRGTCSPGCPSPTSVIYWASWERPTAPGP